MVLPRSRSGNAACTRNSRLAPLVVTARVGRWRSNCVADFAGGAIYVAARHKNIEAAYVLAMFMHTPTRRSCSAAILFGEPKKRASSDLRHNGTSLHGYVERGGVRLIDIRAELTTDLGPETVRGAQLQHQGDAGEQRQTASWSLYTKSRLVSRMIVYWVVSGGSVAAVSKYRLPSMR